MKKFKKISMMALGLVTALAIGTTTAIAESSLETSDCISGEVYEGRFARNVTIEDLSTEGMTLVDETETFEDGLRIVDRTYVKDLSDEISSNSDSSFKELSVSKQRTIYDNGGSYGTIYATMSVWGIFKYNGETAYVDYPGRSYRETTAGAGSYVRDRSFTYASDQGSNFWGNKYACVEYIVTFRLANGEERDFRLWLDVNCKGEINVDG